MGIVYSLHTDNNYFNPNELAKPIQLTSYIDNNFNQIQVSKEQVSAFIQLCRHFKHNFADYQDKQTCTSNITIGISIFLINQLGEGIQECIDIMIYSVNKFMLELTKPVVKALQAISDIEGDIIMKFRPNVLQSILGHLSNQLFPKILLNLWQAKQEQQLEEKIIISIKSSLYGVGISNGLLQKIAGYNTASELYSDDDQYIYVIKYQQFSNYFLLYIMSKNDMKLLGQIELSMEQNRKQFRKAKALHKNLRGLYLLTSSITELQ